MAPSSHLYENLKVNVLATAKRRRCPVAVLLLLCIGLLYLICVRPNTGTGSVPQSISLSKSNRRVLPRPLPLGEFFDNKRITRSFTQEQLTAQNIIENVEEEHQSSMNRTCSETAIAFIGYLRASNSTGPYLRHYIVDDGPYDAFYFGPKEFFAPTKGPGSDPYWRTSHNDKGSFAYGESVASAKATRDSLLNIFGPNLRAYGMYTQNMTALEQVVLSQGWKLSQTFHAPGQDITHFPARGLAFFINFQGAIRLILRHLIKNCANRETAYKRIVFLRPDIVPHFYYRDPKDASPDTSYYSLGEGMQSPFQRGYWATLMYNGDGNIEREKEGLVDIVLSVPFDVAVNAFMHAVPNVLNLWRAHNIGKGHNESTMRAILEIWGESLVVPRDILAYTILRTTAHAPKWPKEHVNAPSPPSKVTWTKES